MAENKYLAPVGCELKLVDDQQGVFTGYGSVFNVTDFQGDVVVPGAFSKSISALSTKGKPLSMLWMHDPTEPIGVWDDVSEDNVGLKLKGRLALETQKGKEAYELMKMGALSGLSIGYRVVDREWKGDIRLLKQVDLLEVSLVTFPANDDARVTGVKTGNERIKTIREFEEFLRDEGGYSCAQAKAIASSGFKAKPEHRDDDGEIGQLLASIQRASVVINPTS
jgi:HK97 family phage prohead protease